MKGLECSEINIKRIDGNLLRLEAEYYKKEYLQLENLIANFDNVEKFVNSIDCGPFGSNMRDTEYKEKGVLVVRPFNLKDSVVENDNLVYVSQELVDSNSLKIYNKGTLLFSRVGDIKVGVLNRDGATISPNIVAVRFNNEKISKFCAIYFQSYYGYLQIKRQLKIAAQPTISTEIIQNLKLPNLPNLIDKIAKIFDNAQAILQQSQSVYHSAEQLLLKSLGLENWQPKNEKTTVKKFSDYEKSGRLDAEYYQPKYDEIEKKIKQNGFVLAKDICSLINYGTVPTSPYTSDDSGTPYIKGMNLKNTAIDDNLDKIVNTDSLDEKFFTKKGDIIISQMGTVADVGVVNEKQENYLFASFTIRMRLKSNVEFNPVFVGMYIQNVAKEYYFYRYIAQASVRQNTDLPTVKNLYIPKIDKSIQKDIAEKVQESFRLRQESKELLERAKRAVEVAIEEGEDKAIEWLKNGDGQK